MRIELIKRTEELGHSKPSFAGSFTYTINIKCLYAAKWGDFITTGKSRLECITKMLEVAKEL